MDTLRSLATVYDAILFRMCAPHTSRVALLRGRNLLCGSDNLQTCLSNHKIRPLTVLEQLHRMYSSSDVGETHSSMPYSLLRFRLKLAFTPSGPRDRRGKPC